MKWRASAPESIPLHPDYQIKHSACRRISVKFVYLIILIKRPRVFHLEPKL